MSVLVFPKKTKHGPKKERIPDQKVKMQTEVKHYGATIPELPPTALRTDGNSYVEL